MGEQPITVGTTSAKYANPWEKLKSLVFEHKALTAAGVATLGVGAGLATGAIPNPVSKPAKKSYAAKAALGTVAAAGVGCCNALVRCIRRRTLHCSNRKPAAPVVNSFKDSNSSEPLLQKKPSNVTLSTKAVGASKLSESNYTMTI